jgi:hypothetical protein
MKRIYIGIAQYLFMNGVIKKICNQLMKKVITLIKVLIIPSHLVQKRKIIMLQYLQVLSKNKQINRFLLDLLIILYKIQNQSQI